ncbi:MAG: PEGA domain-containing protein [Patescibacteria group bacterium]
MSNKLRKILFLLFIISFITITPLVMLYAAGYKLNLGSGRVEKTGVLNIETLPKGAAVYLNGSPRKAASLSGFFGENAPITTPAKIKNLLPGEYAVKLELDGYWDWERKIKINSGEAASFDGIVLIRKDMPLLIASSSGEGASLSPDKKKFTYLSEKGGEIFFTDRETSSGLDGAAEAEKAVWSTDGRAVLIGEKLYKESSGWTGADLSSALKKDYGPVRFDDTNSEKIYFLKSNDIYRVSADLKSAENPIKINGEAEDYMVSGDRLAYASRISSKVFLNIWNLKDAKTERSVELPFSADYEFIAGGNGIIRLLDKTRKILYIIDPAAFAPIKEIINGAGKVYRIDDDNFLFANDFEIWKAGSGGADRELLTRLSREVKDLIWHPDGKFIIFSTRESINMLEISGNERKVTTLANMDFVASPVLDGRGESIYFFGSDKGVKGIYKLRIR